MAPDAFATPTIESKLSDIAIEAALEVQGYAEGIPTKFAFAREAAGLLREYAPKPGENAVNLPLPLSFYMAMNRAFWKRSDSRPMTTEQLGAEMSNLSQKLDSVEQLPKGDLPNLASILRYLSRKLTEFSSPANNPVPLQGMNHK